MLPKDPGSCAQALLCDTRLKAVDHHRSEVSTPSSPCCTLSSDSTVTPRAFRGAASEEPRAGTASSFVFVCLVTAWMRLSFQHFPGLTGVRARLRYGCFRVSVAASRRQHIQPNVMRDILRLNGSMPRCTIVYKTLRYSTRHLRMTFYASCRWNVLVCNMVNDSMTTRYAVLGQKFPTRPSLTRH